MAASRPRCCRHREQVAQAVNGYRSSSTSAFITTPSATKARAVAMHPVE